MKNEICYRCGEKATSQEHVPPRGLFPKIKNISLLSENLITVPSCEKHNKEKSSEDEFLRNVLTGIVGNNEIGYFQNRTKVRRSLERKSGKRTVETILNNAEQTTWTDKQGVVHSVFKGDIDMNRLYDCFESIAYGLFYHERKTVFKGEFVIVPGFVKSKDELEEKKRLAIEKIFEHESQNWPKAGENPEVFFYQMGPTDQYGLTPLKITFYQGTSVYINFIPENTDLPFNLVAAIINGGGKTFLQVNDNETIEFN